jgi:hypothetical protein
VSTKINITVDSGGLSARAKQQQEAARLAQLERERTRRTEAEAKAQRDAKQTAEGKRPDGQPQFGSPPPKPRSQDEPAAFRSVNDYLMLLPSGELKTGIPFPFSKYWDGVGAWASIWQAYADTVNVVYEAQGGPANSPAICTGSDQLPNFNNYGIGAFARFFTANTKSKYAKKPLTGFTLEFFLKLPPIYPIGNFEVYYPGDFIYIDFTSPSLTGIDNLQIEIERFIAPTGDDYRRHDFRVTAPGVAADTMVAQGVYNLDTDRVPISSMGLPERNIALPGNYSPFIDLKWQHYAFVSRQVTVNGQIKQELSFYIDGIRYGLAGLPDNTPMYIDKASYYFDQSQNVNFCSIDMGSLNNRGHDLDTGPLKLHGLKLTPKVLYNGNFTPPSRIRP